MAKKGRFQQQKTKRRGGFGRILLILLLAVVIIVTGAVAAGAVYYNSMLNLITRPEATEVTLSDEQLEEILGFVPEKIEIQEAEPVVAETQPESKPAKKPVKDNIVNIMLIGQQARKNETAKLSDTMILCTIKKDQGKVILTSFLRDTYVKIPGVRKAKMNTAYAYGGMELLADTVLENFGIKVDNTVEVSFTGFMDVIDTIGGVEIELTEAETQLAHQSADFSIRLLQAAEKTEGNKKQIVLSPLSASYALSMVSNGANGDTQQELFEALGFDGFSVEDINAFNKKLMENLVDLDNTAAVHIANSLWLNKDFKAKDAFKGTLVANYEAEVGTYDFGKPETKDLINEWCEEKTNGRIKDFITELFPHQRFVLLNAIYFKGGWKNEFKKAREHYYKHATIENGDILRSLGIAESIVSLMETGNASDSEVDSAYQSTKANLNALFGIEASNEFRRDTVLTPAGIEFSGDFGIQNAPANPKAWYQFGSRIVGWSRIAQICIMELIRPHVVCIVNGDTDSIKCVADESNMQDIENSISKLSRALDKSKRRICSRACLILLCTTHCPI